MKQFVTSVLMAGIVVAAAFGQAFDKSKLVTKNTDSPGKETSATIGG